MASSELCDMTDLPKDQCDHCRHGDKQVVDRDIVRSSLPKAQGDFVVAEYKGICGGCGEDILVGDHISVIEEIRNSKDEVVRKVWAHYGCCE